jgi:hypothetical protein
MSDSEDEYTGSRMPYRARIRVRSYAESGTPCKSRTLKDFSPEEIEDIEKQHGCKIIPR